MFSKNENFLGEDDIAVVSYGLWQRLFGGNSNLGGASIRLNGRAFQVVGVTPPRFDYPGKTDLDSHHLRYGAGTEARRVCFADGRTVEIWNLNHAGAPDV